MTLMTSEKYKYISVFELYQHKKEYMVSISQKMQLHFTGSISQKIQIHLTFLVSQDNYISQFQYF